VIIFCYITRVVHSVESLEITSRKDEDHVLSSKRAPSRGHETFRLPIIKVSMILFMHESENGVVALAAK